MSTQGEPARTASGRSVSPERITAHPLPVSLTLRPVPHSAGTARRFVRVTLDSWGLHELGDAATLLVSELVTNAILHARSDVEVSLCVDPDHVRIQVRDSGPGVPRRRVAASTNTTGRGLALVDALASDWGVEPVDGGKAVWFDLSA